MTATIAAIQLTKHFNSRMILDQVSFDVQPGEIFGMVGPSGAGKSTIIKLLTGQLKADSGQAFLLGKNSLAISTTDLHNIGFMTDLQENGPQVSIWESLVSLADFQRVPLSLLEKLLDYLELTDAKLKTSEQLSDGMKKRLSFIKAVLHKPKVLFLDNPTTDIDPSLKLKIYYLLTELKAIGTSIFLATHDMLEAAKLCDRLAILYQGKIIEQGTPKEIIERHSQKELVRLTYNDGQKKTIPLSELAYHLNPKITSVHSLDTSLEDIFLTLTGEQPTDNQ